MYTNASTNTQSLGNSVTEISETRRNLVRHDDFISQRMLDPLWPYKVFRGLENVRIFIKIDTEVQESLVHTDELSKYCPSSPKIVPVVNFLR